MSFKKQLGPMQIEHSVLNPEMLDLDFSNLHYIKTGPQRRQHLKALKYNLTSTRAFCYVHRALGLVPFRQTKMYLWTCAVHILLSVVGNYNTKFVQQHCGLLRY